MSKENPIKTFPLFTPESLKELKDLVEDINGSCGVTDGSNFKDNKKDNDARYFKAPRFNHIVSI